MTINDAKLRIDALMQKDGSSASMPEVVSVLYQLLPALYRKTGMNLSREDFEDIYQEAILYSIETFDAEKSNGKSFFSFFCDNLKYKGLDHRKAVRQTVSLDAPLRDGEEQTLSAVLPDRLLSPEDFADDEAEQQLLQLVQLLLQTWDTLGTRAASQLRYYRMFFTNQAVAVVREGLAPDCVFLRHERDFLESFDLDLADFTYREPPRTMQALCDGSLKTYRQILPEHPKQDAVIDAPFIKKILQQYLALVHQKPVSEAALTKQEMQFHTFVQQNL